MAKSTKPKALKQETTAQRLSGIIKSCRKIMRKDKGMNGDADRLPMLTWIMFLKFLDDNEQLQEVNAELEGKNYKAAIENPYRWRDWAKDKNLTGADLLGFISNEKVKLAGGNETTGLFYYLRSLQSETGIERKDVIATVFKGVTNRMNNGYLLREVIDKIDEIHFTNNEEINTLSHLYESILKEMRDASGDAGEFYTPRPVVKFMVEMLNPKIGETILDPASGTGGFLVEAFDYLKKQAKTVEQRNVLQTKSIIGGEAKSLPYLLCQMNLLLHGLEYPNIDSGNSLRFPLRDISNNERVDIIVTNPPFGGEEERGILNNFPDDKKTAETALLFLQLIMRKLKRTKPNEKGGRAAVVVPNGTLFAEGVAARIKKQLLDEFNLHSIVRLGEGVFAPYTDIPSNLLFFQQGGPTEAIWYYEVFPPVAKKKYSKTKPLQNDEFSELKIWWDNRIENENAWKVAREEIISEDETGKLLSVNLDIKNPNRKDTIRYRPPIELFDSIFERGQIVAERLKEMQNGLVHDVSEFNNCRWVELGNVITQRKKFIVIDEFTKYKLCRVQTKALGVVLRSEKTGFEIKTKEQQLCKEGDVIFAEMDARFGGYGIIPSDLDSSIVSSHYFLYEIDHEMLDSQFLEYCLKQPWFLEQVIAKGSTNYASIRPHNVLNYQIPLPTIQEQRSIVSKLKSITEIKDLQVLISKEIDELIPSLFNASLKNKDNTETVEE
ncbi:N-6 DNA methylase [Segetibacter aerophilus]|uniref:site-specific DNA-methyltransferase (adenine-specific) n=1 Tax=Segetibacter aerophilus TaxID=670293 RepID=A0A512B8K7_9BACT|nr:N-6 DNA methylase [Segetibacter aerophilus]GEO08295.1 hypothetical protein SAE01_07910 [Segetibacter aerophilus]